MGLLLQNARWLGSSEPFDLLVCEGRVAAAGPPGSTASAGPAGSRPSAGTRTIDLAGAALLPGLVNAHDHLDFSTFPALGRPPYRSLYEWQADLQGGGGDPDVARALALPAVDRLFLGGLRNLLAGVTAAVHHGGFHRSLARADFPIRILSRYSFAHSPGLTEGLRATYRTSDRRVPWVIHAGEGTDSRCAGELDLLAAANVLRQNTVVVHGIAFGSREAERMAAANASLVWCPEANRRLYGATADVDAFLAAGVRVGLGSDSPASGVRDALSNLAAARADWTHGDAALLDLAGTGSAAVARLPAGGREPGAAADLVAVRSVEAMLQGDRRTIALVLVAGRPRYGEPELLAAAGVPASALLVDGARRFVERTIGRRASALLRSWGGARTASWLAALRFDREPA